MTQTKSSSNRVHVVPSGNGWKVIRPNATRVDAVKRGTALAKKDGSTLVKHRKDGRITSATTYGKKKWKI